MKTVEELVQEMIDLEKKYSHIEGSDYRLMFFETLLFMIGHDSKMKSAVQQQFDLFVNQSIHHSTDMYNILNNPCHVVRNGMLVFRIDFPNVEFPNVVRNKLKGKKK